MGGLNLEASTTAQDFVAGGERLAGAPGYIGAREALMRLRIDGERHGLLMLQLMV